MTIDQIISTLLGKAAELVEIEPTDYITNLKTPYNFFYKAATVATAPIVCAVLSPYFLLNALMELTKAIAYACILDFDQSRENLKEAGEYAIASGLCPVFAPTAVLVNLWDLINTAITSCKSAANDKSDLDVDRVDEEGAALL